jgi:hypothetical protein
MTCTMPFWVSWHCHSVPRAHTGVLTDAIKAGHGRISSGAAFLVEQEWVLSLELHAFAFACTNSSESEWSPRSIFSEVRQHHNRSHMQRRPERDSSCKWPPPPLQKLWKKEEGISRACEMLWTSWPFPVCIVSGPFGGLGFLSWYLAGKIRAFDRGGHVAKLCIVILPLLLAAMVAVSRVSHYWQDVFAGSILGRYPPHPSTIDSPSIC